MRTILILSGSNVKAGVLSRALKNDGLAVRSVSTLSRLDSALKREKPHAVVVDSDFGKKGVGPALACIRDKIATNRIGVLSARALPKEFRGIKHLSLPIDPTEVLTWVQSIGVRSPRAKEPRTDMEAAFLENIPEAAILVKSGESKILFANAKARALPLDPSGKLPDWWPVIVDALQNRREPTPRDFQLTSPGGEIKWVRVNADWGADVPAESTVPITFSDITELKRAESALSFIADASAVLASTLDRARALQNLGQIAISGFCDACIIDLRDVSGVGKRVVTAHADHETAIWLEQAKVESVGPERVDLLSRAITGNDPILGAPGEFQVSSVTATGIGERRPPCFEAASGIIAPLYARDAAAGVICFLRCGTNNAYDRQDAGVAEEIARRTSLALENSLLFDEILQARSQATDSARRSALLADASRLVSGSLHYKTILAGVARFSVPALSDWCIAYMPDHQGGMRRVAVVHANPAQATLANELRRNYPRLQIEKDFIDPVLEELRHGHAKLIAGVDESILRRASVSEEHYQFLCRFGAKSVMITPLVSRGNLQGALLFVNAESGRRFTEKDMEFAREVSARAALAVDNALLYETEQQIRRDAEISEHRTALLYELTDTLSVSASVEQAAEIVLRRILPALDAQAGIVVLKRENSEVLDIVVSHGHDEELMKQWSSFSITADAPVAEALRKQETVYIASAEELSARYPGLLKKDNFQTRLAIPMLFEGRIVGAIGISFSEPVQLTSDDLAFTGSFARQCAHALERARLAESETQARNEAQLSHGRLEFLVEASQVLGRSLDYETTLSNVARLAVPHVADWCAVDLLENGEIRRLAVAHHDPAKLEWALELQRRYPNNPNDEVGVAQAIRSGQSQLYLRVTDENLIQKAKDPEHLALLHQVGFSSVIIVPLKTSARVLGSITFVMSDSGRTYSDADLRLAEDLAARAALAVENAGLYRNAQTALQARRRVLVNLRKRARQQGAVAQLSQTALAGSSAKELLEQAVQLVRTNLEVEFSLAQELLPDGNTFAFTAGAGWDISQEKELVSKEISHAGYTLTAGSPVTFLDLLNESRFTGSAFLHRNEVVSGLGVAVPGAERPFGFLGAYSTSRRRFSAYDIYFLSAMANVIGSAIEKKRAEQSRKESETRFQSLIESNLLGIIFANVNGQIIDANDAFLDLLGYTREELNSGLLRWDVMTPPQFQSVDQSILERLRTDGRFSPVEKAYIHKSGRIIPILLGGSILEESPNVTLCFVLDISERNTALQALRESEERFRLLVQSVSDYAILMLDAYGRISSWNEGAERTLGYKAHEVLGRHFSLFYTREDADNGRPEEELALSAERNNFFEEAWRIRKDGSAIWAEMFLRALRNENGGIRGYSLITRDVTDRKQAEEKIRKINEDLEAARDAAVKANMAKSSFLANVSHELRTPLNAIIGYSEMLKEEAVDSGYSDLAPELEKITSAGHHLLSLINEILDLSKVESGKMTLYPEYLDVEDMVREVALTIQPLVQESHNTLELRIQPNVGSMCSDLTKMRQILFNILSNSCKYTENGIITFAVDRETDAQFIRFVISDTGIGMSEEQLDTLFDEFSQSNATTARRYGGTGLGMAITRRFCQLMGGEIDVHSAPGKGTVFTVRLPAETAFSDDEDQKAEAAEQRNPLN